jgi:hypothetical protein
MFTFSYFFFLYRINRSLQPNGNVCTCFLPGYGPSTLPLRNELFHTAIHKQFGGPLISWASVVAYYPQHVSTLGWIAKQVGVVISLAHSILGRAMSNPSITAFQGLKRLYRYLQGHHDLSLVFRPSTRLRWNSGVARPNRQCMFYHSFHF